MGEDVERNLEELKKGNNNQNILHKRDYIQ